MLLRRTDSAPGRESNRPSIASPSGLPEIGEIDETIDEGVDQVEEEIDEGSEEIDDE